MGAGIARLSSKRAGDNCTCDGATCSGAAKVAPPSSPRPRSSGSTPPSSRLASLCHKTFQRHAGPEPIVLAADSVEFGSSRYPNKGAQLVADEADKPLSEVGVRLGMAHFR